MIDDFCGFVDYLGTFSFAWFGFVFFSPIHPSFLNEDEDIHRHAFIYMQA
jgi:hypothetical protein